MNLWAKGTLGQLLMLAVASIFFSCQDDLSIIGYKNPNTKFNVAYREFTPASSVLLLDSFRTSNFNFFGEENRFLVGILQDEKFGEVRAGFFTQYYTTSLAKLQSSSTYDSCSIELLYDFYTYGEPGISEQTVAVYSLIDTLDLSLRDKYINQSSGTYDPEETIIGQKTFAINPTEFKGYIDTGKDTSKWLKMPLNYEFGRAIFEMAMLHSAQPDSAKTTFESYEKFNRIFKGIAVMPLSGDKILRFHPAGTSRIKLHYHTSTRDSLSLDMHFNGFAGFSQILANRDASEISEITAPFTEYKQNDPYRYIQSGTGIVTKLEFNDFLSFADTIPAIVINSGELVISDVDTDGMPPPSRLQLRILGPDNRPKVYDNDDPQDVLDGKLFGGYLASDFPNTQSNLVYMGDNVLFAVNDVGTGAALAWDEEKKEYRGHITQFLHELQKRNGKTRFSDFYLMPIAPLFSKSVNRVVIPADKIKLKIYYTIPTTELTD